MIKVSHMISEMTKIPLQIRLFMIFTVYLMLWKILHMHIYNSVSNIQSCSTLPNFLTDMTLVILTLNILTLSPS